MEDIPAEAVSEKITEGKDVFSIYSGIFPLHFDVSKARNTPFSLHLQFDFFQRKALEEKLCELRLANRGEKYDWSEDEILASLPGECKFAPDPHSFAGCLPVYFALPAGAFPTENASVKETVARKNRARVRSTKETYQDIKEKIDGGLDPRKNIKRRICFFLLIPALALLFGLRAYAWLYIPHEIDIEITNYDTNQDFYEHILKPSIKANVANFDQRAFSQGNEKKGEKQVARMDKLILTPQQVGTFRNFLDALCRDYPDDVKSWTGGERKIKFLPPPLSYLIPYRASFKIELLPPKTFDLFIDVSKGEPATLEPYFLQFFGDRVKRPNNVSYMVSDLRKKKMLDFIAFLDSLHNAENGEKICTITPRVEGQYSISIHQEMLYVNTIVRSHSQATLNHLFLRWGVPDKNGEIHKRFSRAEYEDFLREQSGQKQLLGTPKFENGVYIVVLSEILEKEFPIVVTVKSGDPLSLEDFFSKRFSAGKFTYDTETKSYRAVCYERDYKSRVIADLRRLGRVLQDSETEFRVELATGKSPKEVDPEKIIHAIAESSSAELLALVEKIWETPVVDGKIKANINQKTFDETAATMRKTNCEVALYTNGDERKILLSPKIQYMEISFSGDITDKTITEIEDILGDKRAGKESAGRKTTYRVKVLSAKDAGELEKKFRKIAKLVKSDDTSQEYWIMAPTVFVLRIALASRRDYDTALRAIESEKEFTIKNKVLQPLGSGALYAEIELIASSDEKSMKGLAINALRKNIPAFPEHNIRISLKP